MPEDNLVHLYDGTEVAQINGIERRAPPLKEDMGMIYPKEGALLRENCACLVHADWVSDDEKDGAEAWFEFLRQDPQQLSFMGAGFRSGTGLTRPSSLPVPRGLGEEPPSSVVNVER